MSVPKKKPAITLPKRPKLSQTLNMFFSGLTAPSLTLGELRDALSDRSYGILMFLFALPTLMPMPTPGLSAIVGVPLVLISAQLVVGKKRPWFPAWLTKKRMKKETLQNAYTKIDRYVRWLEFIMRPRLRFLVDPPADRIIALVCLLLALLVLLPVPFSNAFPALAICLFALAITMRDGLFVLVGLIVAVFSAALILAILSGALSGIESWFSS